MHRTPHRHTGTSNGVFVRLSTGLWGVLGVLVVLCFLSANPLLSAASVVVFSLFVVLLWRRGEPPVLVFAVGYQWLQVTAKIIYANLQGVPIEALSWSPHIREATWLSLTGLVVLSLAMHVGLRLLGRPRPAKLVDQISPHRLFLVYLFLTGFGQFVDQYGRIFLGLQQPLAAAAEAKWALFFLLGFCTLYRRSHYYLLGIAFFVEFILGIGFFSGFKTVFFFFFLTIATYLAHSEIKTSISSRALAAVVLIGGVLFVLGTTWHSIRGEYRAYLNQGTTSQRVLVPWTDQMQKMGELVSEVDREDLIEATDPALQRLSYTDYFAASMDYVPESRRHTGGKLWGQSIQHILMPRLFFPQKPILPSDTELTARYTGLDLAGREQGTSISLGYMAESYVDFGKYGMFIPVLLVGLLWGFMYYLLMSQAPTNLVGHGFVTAVLFNAHQFEMASIKLLGSVVVVFVVLLLIEKYLAGRVFRWLLADPSRETPSPALETTSFEAE